MKTLSLLLLFSSFHLSAAFNEDCKGKAKELESFVNSSEMILFSQMQNAYEDTINVCREVYSRFGDEDAFIKRVNNISSSCDLAYEGKDYDEKFFDLLQCKVAKLYNMER